MGKKDMMLAKQPMIATQCAVCVHEDAEYIGTKVAKKDMSDVDAAKHFKVSERVWAAHYEEHVRKRIVNALSTDIVPLKEIVVEKVAMVSESCDRLRKVVLFMSEQILLVKPENFDSKEILALGQMERNLVQTVKDLAMIQGELNSGDTVNIQVNIEKAERFSAIMMENACSKCRPVFLRKLEDED